MAVISVSLAQEWDWWMANYDSPDNKTFLCDVRDNGDIAVVVNTDNPVSRGMKLKGSFQKSRRLMVFDKDGKVKASVPFKRKVERLLLSEKSDSVIVFLVYDTTSAAPGFRLLAGVIKPESLVVTDSIQITAFLEKDTRAAFYNFSSTSNDAATFSAVILGKFEMRKSQINHDPWALAFLPLSVSIVPINQQLQGARIYKFNSFSTKVPPSIQRNTKLFGHLNGTTSIYDTKNVAKPLHTFSDHVEHLSVVGTEYFRRIDNQYALIAYDDSLIIDNKLVRLGEKKVVLANINNQKNWVFLSNDDNTLDIQAEGTPYWHLANSQTLKAFRGSTHEQVLYPFRHDDSVGIDMLSLDLRTTNKKTDTSFRSSFLLKVPDADKPFPKIVMPYDEGAYIIIPQGLKHANGIAIEFEDEGLDASGLQTSNMIVNLKYLQAELEIVSTCNESTVSVSSNAQETHTSWTIMANNDTTYLEEEQLRFTPDDYPNGLYLKAVVSNKYGFTRTITDSLPGSANILPDVTIPSGEKCQWNTYSFQQNSKSALPLSHIWEFWKNDTVFMSDTVANPTVHFTNPGVYTLKYYVSNSICKKGLVLKDTIIVKPAERAQIQGLPFPICSGSHVKLTPKPSANTRNRFTWYDGTTSINESKKVIGKEPLQWVRLTTTSSNGCETQDSAYFRVRLSGNKVADSVITGQDLTPTFYLSPSQGFTKFRFQRNDGTSDQILWHKPNHRDASVSLKEMTEGYTITGLDSCGNKALTETWYPPLLTLLEDENQLALRPSGVGQQEHQAKRGKGKWLLLSHGLNEIDLDTLSDIYQFRYREYNPNTQQAAISNMVEVAPINKFILPNAFSPNGDGINDIFSGVQPRSTEIESIQIFARNGQVVQHTDDIQNIWDGKVKGLEAPVGTYTYVISYQQEGESKSLSGEVMLVK